MKILLVACLVVATHDMFAQGVAWESLPHQNTVPFSARISFARLAQGTLSDQDKGIEELVNTPDIAPVLMELLDKVYRDSDDYYHLYTILNVLMRRRDLAEYEQGILRSELDGLWNKPGSTNSVVLKDYGLRIIANYPGAANEDLLLKYLKEPKSLEVVGFPLNAVEGLEKIGTSRSLEALQAYRSEQSEGSGRYKAASGAIETITAREKKTTSPKDDGSTAGGNRSAASRGSPMATSNMEGDEGKLNAAGQGIGWTVACIALLVAVAVALAAGRKSKPKGS